MAANPGSKEVEDGLTKIIHPSNESNPSTTVAALSEKDSNISNKKGCTTPEMETAISEKDSNISSKKVCTTPEMETSCETNTVQQTQNNIAHEMKTMNTQSNNVRKDENSINEAAKSKRKKHKPKKKKQTKGTDGVSLPMEELLNVKRNPVSNPVSGNDKRPLNEQNESKAKPKKDEPLKNQRGSTPQRDQINERNKSETLDEPVMTDEVKALLEENCVFPLKKKSVRFPTAKFFCRLCEYHCDNVNICQKHIKDTRHLRLKQIKATNYILRSLPPPTLSHIEALDSMLEFIYQEKHATEADLKSRKEIVRKLEEFVSEKLPEKKMLTCYGSTVSGFALKSSDVNIDIQGPAKTLVDIFESLRNEDSGFYTEVQSNFSAKVPCVLFKAGEEKVRCQVTINNQSACQTSKLLSLYTAKDSRVKKIAVIFRHWAKLCQVDNQEAGTLPPYVFGLMTVYFMQQCKPPLLPVLSESQKEQDITWTTKNKGTLGAVWLMMLQFYSYQFDTSSYIISIRQSEMLSKQKKNWSSKRISIEDPIATKRNVARTVSHTHVHEYIYDRVRAAYLYFGIPQTKQGPMYTEDNFKKFQLLLQKDMKKIDSKEHQSNAGKCDIYKTERQSEESVHSSEQSSHIAEKVKLCTPEETLNISLDACDKDNSKSSVGPSQAAESVQTSAETRMENSEVKSTETPANHTDSGEIVCDIKMATKPVSSDEDGSPTEKKPVSDQSDEESVSEVELSEASAEQEEQDEDASKDKKAIEIESEDETTPSPTPERTREVLESFGLADKAEQVHHVSRLSLVTDDILEILDNMTVEDYLYVFSKETLTDGKGPAVMCSICQQEGHLKKNCPEEKLPELEPLPPLDDTYKCVLDQILHNVPNDFEPTEREKMLRKEVLYELENFIRDFLPEARLQLFGSSENGFGFSHSDLDICMTLENIKSSEEIDAVEVIEYLAKRLKAHKGLYNVIPITSAKVPIVKFVHRRSQLEGDISLYNTLALRNTKMLKMYCDLDYRVKVLGYTMKVFAKVCDIGDASRGSLSSYAYILMVLYFLQQRKPPVIPVLQELPSEEKKELIVDGWNAWFFEHFREVRKVWTEWGTNTETVGELWIGLLRFYTESFNHKDLVISIRQQKPMTRFERLWNGYCFAIEDPFDLSHNLGGGLSRRMHTFIVKALRNGRDLFGRSVQNIPPGYPTLQDYLFDPALLIHGDPPNDRGCRICGKIGHFAKECPVVINRKERKERERERRVEATKDKRETPETSGDRKYDEESKVRDTTRKTRNVSEGSTDGSNHNDKRKQQYQRSRSEGQAANHPYMMPHQQQQMYYNSQLSDQQRNEYHPVPSINQIRPRQQQRTPQKGQGRQAAYQRTGSSPFHGQNLNYAGQQHQVPQLPDPRQGGKGRRSNQQQPQYQPQYQEIPVQPLMSVRTNVAREHGHVDRYNNQGMQQNIQVNVTNDYYTPTPTSQRGSYRGHLRAPAGSGRVVHANNAGTGRYAGRDNTGSRTSQRGNPNHR